eukprot:TRINITY_DN105482_c0_g1_i1.p1 TRINITY_DN105482_c0_g1~~TRINITY_DN105482_c0_g1_i1.p1  ORF type:complete len:432 (+),score=44.05 TRINITY_DN105482_c0_g1_i1:178-1473(+)
MREQQNREGAAQSADEPLTLTTSHVPTNDAMRVAEHLLQILLNDGPEDNGAACTVAPYPSWSQPLQAIQLHPHVNSSESTPTARTLQQPCATSGSSQQFHLPAKCEGMLSRESESAAEHSNWHERPRIVRAAAGMPATDYLHMPSGVAQSHTISVPASTSTTPLLPMMATSDRPHVLIQPYVVPVVPVVPAGVSSQTADNSHQLRWPAMHIPSARNVQLFFTQAQPLAASHAGSASASSPPRQVLPSGTLHRFHESAARFGRLSDDCRTFRKEKRKGRSLTLITEEKGHSAGVVHYLVQFTVGERGDLCSADGVGILFNPRFPCTQNLHSLKCIFLARSGHICTRCEDSVSRSGSRLPEVQRGDYVEIRLDFEQCLVGFKVWSEASGGRSDPEYTEVPFHSFLPQDKKRKRITACLAAVIKHCDVGLTVLS